jgi:hypothetical protein
VGRTIRAGLNFWRLEKHPLCHRCTPWGWSPGGGGLAVVSVSVTDGRRLGDTFGVNGPKGHVYVVPLPASRCWHLATVQLLCQGAIRVARTDTLFILFTLPGHAQAGGEGVAGVLVGDIALVANINAHRLGHRRADREAHHRAVALWPGAEHGERHRGRTSLDQCASRGGTFLTGMLRDTHVACGRSVVIELSSLGYT